MSFYINDVSPEECFIGENEVTVIFYNNVPVWSKPGTAWEGWGDETAIGDASWWADLKAWVLAAAPEDRQACVGKTKKVSLSTTFRGCNAVLMRCIGADQDGIGTLTFHSAGALPQKPTETAQSWIDSQRRVVCQNFYNYCSAKESIKTVSKGTCPDYSNNRTGTAVYNDETVWLLSELEIGCMKYAPLSKLTSTPTNAECTYGYAGVYTYYDSNESRIKYLLDADGNLTDTPCYYVLRSRNYYYYNTNYVAVIDTVGQENTSSYAYNCYITPAFVIG